MGKADVNARASRQEIRQHGPRDQVFNRFEVGIAGEDGVAVLQGCSRDPEIIRRHGAALAPEQGQGRGVVFRGLGVDLQQLDMAAPAGTGEFAPIAGGLAAAGEPGQESRR